MLSAKRQRYYVYELVDPRDGAVFYVGKGSGKRMKQHVRNARSGRIDNVEKFRRINDICESGLEVVERVASWHETEVEAYAAERAAISSLRDTLTNIVGGTCSNLERVAERARVFLSRLKPLEEWIAAASPCQIAYVTAAAGSPQEWYSKFKDSLEQVAMC